MKARALRRNQDVSQFRPSEGDKLPSLQRKARTYLAGVVGDRHEGDLLPEAPTDAQPSGIPASLVRGACSSREGSPTRSEDFALRPGSHGPRPIPGEAARIPRLTRALRWGRGGLVRKPGSTRDVRPRSGRALGKSAALRG